MKGQFPRKSFKHAKPSFKLRSFFNISQITGHSFGFFYIISIRKSFSFLGNQIRTLCLFQFDLLNSSLPILSRCHHRKLCPNQFFRCY